MKEIVIRQIIEAVNLNEGSYKTSIYSENKLIEELVVHNNSLYAMVNSNPILVESQSDRFIGAILKSFMCIPKSTPLAKGISEIPGNLIDYEEYKKKVVEAIYKEHESLYKFVKAKEKEILSSYDNTIDITKMTVVLRSNGPKNVKFLSACAKVVSLPEIATHRLNVNFCYLK